MEYHELKQLWEKADNLELNIALNQKAISELTNQKLKNNLSEIKWSSIIEIFISFFWYIFLMNFCLEYYQESTYLISAILLILITIFSLGMEFNKLYLYYSIDYGFSIVKAQKKIEKLKFLELLDINLLYLFIPLFFVPFLLVFSKGMLHIDLFELGFGFVEMAGLFLGSIIVGIFVVFFLRKVQLKKLNDSLRFLKEIDA